MALPFSAPLADLSADGEGAAAHRRGAVRAPPGDASRRLSPTVRVEGPSSPRGHGAPACEVVCARARVDVESVDSRSAKLEARHFQEDLVRAVPMPEP